MAQTFLGGLANDGLDVWGQIEKSKADAKGTAAAAELEKYKYLNSQKAQPQQPTGDPNAYREAEPVKGTNNDGSTLVQAQQKTYGGVPVWGWGLGALVVLMMLVIGLGRGRR